MRAILESHPVKNLKAIMKELKQPLAGYSKMKKAELVDRILELKKKGFPVPKVEMYEKPPRKAPAKKEKTFPFTDPKTGKKGEFKEKKAKTQAKKAKKEEPEDNLKKAIGVSRKEANKMDFFDLMKLLPQDIKRNIGGQVKAGVNEPLASQLQRNLMISNAYYEGQDRADDDEVARGEIIRHLQGAMLEGMGGTVNIKDRTPEYIEEIEDILRNLGLLTYRGKLRDTFLKTYLEEKIPDDEIEKKKIAKTLGKNLVKLGVDAFFNYYKVPKKKVAETKENLEKLFKKNIDRVRKLGNIGTSWIDDEYLKLKKENPGKKIIRKYIDGKFHFTVNGKKVKN